MAPTRTANLRSSRTPSRGRSADDEVINQIVAERLKALLKANRIRFVNPSSGMFRPRCDVYDDLSSSIVTAMFELPGVKRSEIALNLREGALVVQGERLRPGMKCTSQSSYSRFPAPSDSTATKANESEFKHRYVIEELRYGKFERRITLPHGIKDADIKAHMAEGILIVTWPRQPTNSSVPFASSK